MSNYSDDPSGQTVSLPSDDDIAERYNATHENCVTCGATVCIDEKDGTNNCQCDDRGEVIEGDAVHHDCMSHFLTCLIRDEIKMALEERTGFELNAMTIAERSNNTSIRVYEALRQFGFLAKGK